MEEKESSLNFLEGHLIQKSVKVWEIVSAISTMVLAVTAILALGFARAQIAESRHEAQAAHLVEAVHDFDGTVTAKLRLLARKRIDQKAKTVRLLDTDDPPSEMYDVLNFFDYLGLQAKRGYLDVGDAWDVFSYDLFNFYTDARPLIDAEQKDDSATFANVSWLMGSIGKLETNRNRGIGDHPSQVDIYGYYSDLIETAGPLHPAGRRPTKK